MKNKYLFFLLLFLFCSQSLYSQSEIKKIEIYLIQQAKTNRFLYSIENMKKNSEAYFETDLIYYLDVLFDDYKDCVNKLKNYPILDNNIERIEPRVCVDLIFRRNGIFRKTVRIYFSNEGYFYYNGHWRQKHNGLYYNLFRNFYNVLIPIETINDSKIELDDSKEW